eukprot:scaffold8606_cov91-Amphora_coffeaeformis.AAC.1
MSTSFSIATSNDALVCLESPLPGATVEAGPHLIEQSKSTEEKLLRLRRLKEKCASVQRASAVGSSMMKMAPGGRVASETGAQAYPPEEEIDGEKQQTQTPALSAIPRSPRIIEEQAAPALSFPGHSVQPVLAGNTIIPLTLQSPHPGETPDFKWKAQEFDREQKQDTIDSQSTFAQAKTAPSKNPAVIADSEEQPGLFQTPKFSSPTTQ